MNRAVDVACAARSDILEITDYLSEHSEFAPDHFFVDIEARFRSLAASASLGRVVDDSGQRPGALRRTRVSPRFGNYLIFYRAYRRHIRVVRILHAARDAITILRLPR